MLESGAGGKIAVDSVVLFAWCALGQMADHISDFFDWVLHGGCDGCVVWTVVVWWC